MNTTNRAPAGRDAFLASPALQADVVARVAAAIETRRLTSTSVYEWDASTGIGSMTGLAAQAPDMEGYVSALGWPYALGATHELLIRSTQRLSPDPAAANPEEAPPLVALDPELTPQYTAWLRSIVPGSDLSLALLAFQRRLADALLDGLPLLGRPSAQTQGLVEAWRQLLRVEPQGEPAAEPWARLRQQAGELAGRSRHAQRFVAELIEAAAWPYQDAAVDWPAGWEAFMRVVVRLNIETVLDAETAGIVRAGDAAWEALERRAIEDPTLDVFDEAEKDPHLSALNRHEIQERVEAAQQVHARPLVQALLAHFNASVSAGAARTTAAVEASATQGFPADGGGKVGGVTEVVGDDDFRTHVVAATGLVLVDFWAPWCGPCVQFMPSFMKLAEQYAGQVKFVKVNLDDNEALGESLNIRSLPTVIVYDAGSPVERINALNRGRICAVLDARLSHIPGAASPRSAT